MARSARSTVQYIRLLGFQGLAGFYQDEEGSFTCKQCPAGTTTLLLGTKSGVGHLPLPLRAGISMSSSLVSTSLVFISTKCPRAASPVRVSRLPVECGFSVDASFLKASGHQGRQTRETPVTNVSHMDLLRVAPSHLPLSLRVRIRGLTGRLRQWQAQVTHCKRDFSVAPAVVDVPSHGLKSLL